jgi:hypothetical protein
VTVPPQVVLQRSRHDNGKLTLCSFDHKIPAYAILSHTWDTENNKEVTFEDLEAGIEKGKAGYRKIEFCEKQATAAGLQYFWIDTCCINRRSETELSEAVNSMFRRYQKANRCYVYLSDVNARDNNENGQSSQKWEPAFRKSRWFTRGWTLQELIAPRLVEFFSEDGKRLGDKSSLETIIHQVTGIAQKALQGDPLSDFSVEERKSWATQRSTKREEDGAYSLLGIFDLSMPLIYGEGKEKALKRLDNEIRKILNGEH